MSKRAMNIGLLEMAKCAGETAELLDLKVILPVYIYMIWYDMYMICIWYVYDMYLWN